MRSSFGVTLALFFAQVATSSAAEPAARQLSQPAWWVARAGAELESVADPEEHALLASMISSAQGAWGRPEDLPKALEKCFAEQRARLGDDAGWQFALYAARRYEESARFSEAIAALERGRAAIAAIPDQVQRDKVQRELDSELSSVISRIASKGDIVLALQATRQFAHQAARDAALDQLAHARSSVDLATAEMAAGELSDAQTRLLLLLHCRGGAAGAYERAIGLFLADRSAMESRDVRRCYVALVASLASLPRDVRPQTLDALQGQLARDATPGANENARGEASRCLATLLIMRGQLAAARDVKDQKGRPLLRGQFGNQAARLLVAQGMYEEAAAMSSQSLGDIAVAHLAAGRHHEALLIIERLEHDAGGGTATMAACQFAERDDWDRIERAVATIGDDVSRGSCLTELAAIAVRKGRLDRVMPLLHAARERLVHIADLDTRSQAAEYLARAYSAAGAAKAAWELVNREGDDFARARVLVDMAGHQLNAKDAAGFAQSMERLDSILARDRLHVSRPPEGDDSPEWRGPRQVAFALVAARLHLRAGDKARAGEAIRSGFARAGSPPGIGWRADVYFESLVDAKPTPEALAEIADIVELVPTPTDRAMLAVVGSAMAAEMNATR